jgi:hypothetical protein
MIEMGNCRHSCLEAASAARRRWHNGYVVTSAPLNYDGVVYSGIAGGEFGVRGRLTALDAKTGKILWRWYTLPGPGEVGSDTWRLRSCDARRGSDMEHAGSRPRTRPGLFRHRQLRARLRWLDTRRRQPVLCLDRGPDAKTGEYVWHFQEVHHDIWDYDATSRSCSSIPYSTVSLVRPSPKPAKLVGCTSSTAGQQSVTQRSAPGRKSALRGHHQPGRIGTQSLATAPVTPFGQLPFFIEYLKAGRVVRWLGSGLPIVAQQPECLAQTRSAGHRAAVGSSVLAGHRRYAHITALRGDRASPMRFALGRPAADGHGKSYLVQPEQNLHGPWPAAALPCHYVVDWRSEIRRDWRSDGYKARRGSYAGEPLVRLHVRNALSQ